MIRVLPTVNIHGKEFIVDVDKTEIRQMDRPENTMSFHDMIDFGTKYTFICDTKDLGITAPDDHKNQNFLSVELPPMAELDPIGMAEKYGKAVEDIKGKTDFEIMVDQELLQERLTGKLPLIDIARNSYIVDIRLKELRMENDPLNRINLRDLEFSPDGTHYQFYYDSNSKQALAVHPALSPYQGGILYIEIPNELKLDPVAVARDYEIGENDLLRRFPPQKDLKAKVTPVTRELHKELCIRHKQHTKTHSQKKSKSWKL